MDLQKVALQANGNTVQNGQRADTRTAESSKTGLPFANFIRPPMMAANDLFANRGHDDTHDDIMEARRPAERQDVETGRDQAADDSTQRAEAPDSPAREHNTREENTADDGRENDSQRNEASHNDSEGRENEERETHTQRDETPRDDNQEPDDAPDQRADQETDSDQAADPQDRQDAGQDAGQGVATEGADADVVEGNRVVEGSTVIESATVVEGGTDAQSNAPSNAQAAAPASITPDDQHATVVDAAPAINAALQSVLPTTQSTDPALIGEEVLRAVKEAIARENVQRTGDAGNRQNTPLTPEAGAEFNTVQRTGDTGTRQNTPLNTGTDAELNTAQRTVGSGNPQNIPLNPQAEAELNNAIQQALRQIVRQGTGAGQTNPTAEAAAKSADTSVAQQQAQALASTLKSDKPVRINVNVDNRANAAVSQSGQTLSANVVAAQADQSGTSANANANPFQSGERPAQLQAQTALNNPGAQVNVQTNAQAQAAAQAAATVAANSGERSTTRILAQATTAGQHGATGGAEATGSSPSASPLSQGQHMTPASKPQQAQAPQAGRQPQPVAQQISVNITKAIAEGTDRISIQLRPDNLGRVEVKLNVGADGRVSAQIIADRPEALEALRNDSRNLEKALQDAGLQANAGDLSFNLRNQQENPEHSDSDNRMAGNEEDAVDGDLEAELAARILDGRLGDIISDTRIDIQA